MHSHTTFIPVQYNPPMQPKEEFKFSFDSITKPTRFPETQFTEVLTKDGKYYTWGADNRTPTKLKTLYDFCSLHFGIVNKKTSYVYGLGLYSVSDNKELNDFIKKCNSKGDSLNHIFRRVCEDNEKYGGFALQVINDNAGDFSELAYTDISNFRVSGSQDKLLYSRDWDCRKDKLKVITYDKYYPGYSGSADSIFWYTGNSRDFYPKEPYRGALMGIEQLTELDKFGIAAIQNGFFSSLMMTFEGNFTEEQKEDIKQSVEGRSGSNQIGKVMLSFIGDGMKPPVLQPIEQSDVVNQFNQQRENAIDSIFMGSGINARQIFGIQIAGKLGGASKDFQEGTEIFVQDYVQPVQRELMEVLNQLLSVKFPNADLAVREIPPIGGTFENELAMVANMTQDEYRAKLKLQGAITDVKIPEGSIMSILPLKGDTPSTDLPVPPPETPIDPTIK
jgi:hypothetical protein